MQARTRKALSALYLLGLIVAVAWAIQRPGLDSTLAVLVAAAALVAHVSLHKKAGARITFLFMPGPPYEETEPAVATGKALRYFSVGVRNTGDVHLQNCLVKLIAMKAIDGRPFKNVFLPIGLLTQQQQLQERRGGEFNLRLGETKYVRLASLDELDDAAEIALPYEAPRLPNLVQRGDYLLTLEALGGDVPERIQIRLWTDSDGTLHARQYVPSTAA